jgi:hypothetical protein
MSFLSAPPSSPRNLRVVEVYKDYIVIAWDEPEISGGDSLLGYQVCYISIIIDVYHHKKKT